MGVVMRGVQRFDAWARRPVARFLALAASLTLSGPPAPASEAHEPLLGRTKASAILAIAPEWRSGYDAYHPDPADVEAIRDAPPGSLLMVYFGSWCSDSRIGVPHFLKIVDEAHPSRLKVRYVGVDRSKKEPSAPLEGVGLELVPTFVLSVDGREVGRIVETPRTTLEHDLALLVGAAQSLEGHAASGRGKAASGPTH